MASKTFIKKSGLIIKSTKVFFLPSSTGKNDVLKRHVELDV